MRFKIWIIFFAITMVISCKSGFPNKQLTYSANKDDEFKILFLNDSIFKVTANGDEATYKYELSEKIPLLTTKENQPVVNFKTKKMHGQYYRNLNSTLISGKSKHFQDLDTLIMIKMKIDDKMTRRLYFDNRKKFLEF